MRAPPPSTSTKTATPRGTLTAITIPGITTIPGRITAPGTMAAAGIPITDRIIVTAITATIAIMATTAIIARGTTIPGITIPGITAGITTDGITGTIIMATITITTMAMASTGPISSKDAGAVPFPAIAIFPEAGLPMAHRHLLLPTVLLHPAPAEGLAVQPPAAWPAHPQFAAIQ